VDSSGNLYGTTLSGGSNGDGTLYEWVKSSGTLVTLASFNGTNGMNPEYLMIENGSGNFFGTTDSGGANNDGTIFETIGGVKVTATAAITVTPGSYSLAKSLVTVSKPGSVAPGKTITVFLQTKDAAGNSLTTDLLGTGTISFELGNSTGGKGTFSSATFVGNGEYEATFTATNAGINLVEALIDSSKVTSKAPTLEVT
jgi:uncharacterized repeat protein (TIGR03803 family)